jgi:hypothetical protein
MIEDKQQMFSDDAIRGFLLGSLNSTDQSRFEHSLFIDDTLEERVRLAELELSDDYTANRLSRADRDLFRKRFLLTAERERKLEVSRALHHNFAVPDSIARATFWQNAVSIFDIRRHAWKYAFAALALMLLLLTTALLVKKDQPRWYVYPFKPPKAGPKASAASTPRMMGHSNNAPAPSHSETSPALPLHEGLTTSVVLQTDTPLESAPTISASGDNVTVQLTLDAPVVESYEVNVMTMAGESVFSSDVLKRSEGQTLGFEVPTDSLKTGDFQVILTRVDGDSKQIAGTYYFRVR